MSVPVPDAAYPTPDEIRDILLRTIAFTFARYGLVANTLPGSDHYIRAEAYASRVSIAIANNQLALQDFSPLSATGDALKQLAAVFGVFPRPAAPAAGSVTIGVAGGGTVVIPQLFQCISPDGQVYQTTAPFTRSNGGSVDVIAAVPGASTNQAAGTKCTWSSAAIGALNPLCTVSSAGLVGGADADNDDVLRARLLRKLAFPAVGGNWSSVVEWAEEATASVGAAYAYPAVAGPGSYDVALVGQPGSLFLSGPTVAIVAAYINSKMPGQNLLNATAVVGEALDVTLALALPLPTSAGGAGGGWIDATPWPSEDVKVTAWNAGTLSMTTTGTASPVQGDHIAVWDPIAAEMGHFAILTAPTGSPGAWAFTVQGSGTVAVGAYVSADAVNLDKYAAAFDAQMSSLGPGEKSADPWVVPRGRRQPQTDAQAPSGLTNVLLSRTMSGFTEVADYAYGIHYLTGTTTDKSDADLPAATTDPPNLLTLKYFAIRAA